MSQLECDQTTESVEETERLGGELAASLSSGDVVFLSGPLGAGKSAFARGVAQGLGATNWLGSPTFTIVHEYDTQPYLYHVDLYRLRTESVEELGLEDYFNSSAIVLVEWPERAPALLNALSGTQFFRVKLDLLSPTSRRISMRRVVRNSDGSVENH